MKSMGRDLGEIVARSSSIQDQTLEQSAKGSYSSFLFASTGVSSGNTKPSFRGARHRRESLSEMRSSEEPRPRQIVSSETLKERLRRETIEALDREWERGALPDGDLRGRENGKRRSDNQVSYSGLEKSLAHSRESSSGITKFKPKAKERKTVWRISKVEIYSVEKSVAQTTELTNTAMDLLNFPPTVEEELAHRSCTEPSSEQEQDIGQDSELNEERIREAPSDTSMETDSLPPPLFEVGKNVDQQRNLRLPCNVTTSQPLKQLRLEDRKTTSNFGNSVDAWKISMAHELHNCVSAGSSGCDEKCLICYERGNEIVADPFRNPNLGYLHQRHVDRGKQDPALEFTQNLDCGYSVRSNRAFQPNQIIIQDTNQENLLVPIYQENTPDRWVNSVDRLSKHANLLPSDPDRVGDARQTSIVRFIKHSSRPNCVMIMWTVNSQARVALLAGVEGIVFGEELTYDHQSKPYVVEMVEGSAVNALLAAKYSDQTHRHIQWQHEQPLRLDQDMAKRKNF